MTVTSNIHPNLNGWSNASYSVGDRVYNGTNAYVCSSAGTSTAPPSGTGMGIAPGGTALWNFLSTYDYVDLVTWAASIPSTRTQPIVGLLWYNNNQPLSTSLGVQVLKLSGHGGASSTNTITLMAAPIDGFQAVFQTTPTTAYATVGGTTLLVMPYSGAGNVIYFEVDDDWVIFQGLQFVDINRGNASTMIGGTGAHFTLTQCIIDSYAAASWPIFNFSGASTTFINNLILDRGSVGATAWTAQITGTGARIANNTLSQGGGTNASTAFHSVATTTSGTNTAINNILVNYGTDVFKANSGTPWATNHNAYTNSSFGTNGTDTGGSVYNITPSATFINFINDFHLQSGSSCIDAGATDTTDIPAAVDAFGVSRPQGVAWDIGSHEDQATTVVTRDFVMPVTFNVSKFNDITFPADNKRTHAQDKIVPAEWRGVALSPVLQSNFPLEILGSWPILPNPFSSDFSSAFGGGTWTATPILGAPIEWSLSAINFGRNTTFGIEWRATTQTVSAANAEWRAPVTRDTPASIDWSAPVVTRDVAAPIEWFRTFIGVNATGSIDWKSTVAQNATPPVEWGGFTGVVRDTLVQIEWGNTIARNAPASIDWSSPVVTRDVALPIEWASAHSYDWVSPIEWLTTAVTTPVTVPITWGASLTVNATPPLETNATGQRDATAPVETGQTVTGSDVAAVETGASVVAQVTAPSDHYSTQRADAGAPAEWGGIRIGSGSDATVSIEWRMSLTADMVAQVQPLGTIQEDAVAPVEWQAGRQRDATAPADWVNPAISVDVPASVEWGHTLSTRTVDATFTIEHLSIVSSDMAVNFFLDIGRESIGSSLQPDSWECNHEP